MLTNTSVVKFWPVNFIDLPVIDFNDLYAVRSLTLYSFKLMDCHLIDKCRTEDNLPDKRGIEFTSVSLEQLNQKTKYTNQDSEFVK